MKDCWQVLDIPSTTDVEAVKRAYRVLIKRYHPDTIASGSPEMVQRYTVKCGRINQAFRQAIEQCTAGVHADLGTGAAREEAVARKRWGEAARQARPWRPPDHPSMEQPRFAEVRNAGTTRAAVTYLAPLLVIGCPFLIVCFANMLLQMAYLLASR
jgi:hypothetical protein